MWQAVVRNLFRRQSYQSHSIHTQQYFQIRTDCTRHLIKNLMLLRKTFLNSQTKKKSGFALQFYPRKLDFYATRTTLGYTDYTNVLELFSVIFGNEVVFKVLVPA